MEFHLAENAKVDEKGKQISRYCLGLPTILRKILEQFTTKELIKLSSVNKLWNFEARSVMRKRGNLIANLWPGGAQVDRCQKLVAFASDLDNMPVVPFSGINFTICHREDCQSTLDGSLDTSYKVILDRLQWKNFIVDFYDHSWDSYKNFPALVLIRRILEDFCGVLEELTVHQGRESFLRSIFDGRSFPRLKSLDIRSGECGTADPSWTSPSIKALVFYAPSLQKLCVDDSIDLTVNILEGSSAVLVPTESVQPLVKPIFEGLIGSLRADAMQVYLHKDDFDSRLLSSLMPKLLDASRSTLETLVIDFLFFVPLMCYGICLENVTTLQIEMNWHLTDDIEPSILKLPTGLDFTRVFPKLNKVKILNDYAELDLDPDVVGAFIEQGKAVLGRALPDRAINIRVLELARCGYMEDCLPLLAQIFPDVKTMELFREPNANTLVQLREHFRGLEAVTKTVPKYHF